MAARLEQAAGPGTILIGAETYRLLRDARPGGATGALELKGAARPMEAWRLLSLEPSAQAVARRADTPFVGRSAELGELEAALERSVGRGLRAGHDRRPPGIGKSRLAAELGRGPALEATSSRAAACPTARASPTRPSARDRRWLGPWRDERQRARRDRWRRDGRGAGGQPRDLRWWALRTPARGRGDGLGLRRGLRGAGAAAAPGARDRGHPLGRADPARPARVHRLDFAARPILLVCLARPELFDARPAWGGGKTNATSILLERLPDEDCARLLDELLGGSTLSSERRRRVVGAAEGNPLFVEQMLAMLDEDERKGDVPVSIQALLAARLDHLEGGERQVVESASVEGRVFHRSAVAALGPDSARPALSAHLQRLMRRELIDPDRSLFEGDSAYRFQHVLIRDAAYASLPKRARAELHERFAEWLEERVAQRVDEYREILAHHLEQAYLLLADVAPDDPRLPGLAAGAIDSLTAADRHADERGDETAALPSTTALRPAQGGPAPPPTCSSRRRGPESTCPTATMSWCSRTGPGTSPSSWATSVRELHAEIIPPMPG